MWDWDAEQTAKKPPTRRVGWRAGSIVAGVVVVALVHTVLVVALHKTGPGRARDGVPAAQPSFRLDDDQIGQAARILSDDVLRPLNRDPLQLGPAETLVLSDADQVLRLTPGAVRVRTDGCSATPVLAVAMTVTAERGAATWDPAAFRLVDVAGREAGVHAGCAGALGAHSDVSPGDELSGELAFAAGSPRWLVYAPIDGTVQARWRLS